MRGPGPGPARTTVRPTDRTGANVFLRTLSSLDR